MFFLLPSLTSSHILQHILHIVAELPPLDALGPKHLLIFLLHHLLLGQSLGLDKADLVVELKESDHLLLLLQFLQGLLDLLHFLLLLQLEELLLEKSLSLLTPLL